MPPTLHHRACNLCEAMCGVVVELEGGQVRRVHGDPEDPFSKGHVCPKVVGLQDLLEDPDRLRQPMRRTATGWQTVGWDAALDEAASRLHEIQERHGRDAVATYSGNPNVHNTGSLLTGPIFLRTLRTRNRYSATSVDQLPHMLAALWMFGHQLLMPVPDLDRTQHLLILGANPVASNGSLMTAPGVRGRLAALRARGGRLVVVDPRRTETAALADAWHPIRPGTDAWLLAALVHVLIREGARLGRLAEHAEGLEALRAAVAPHTPERAAGPTGLSAATIEALAADLRAAESAVVYGRMGTSTQRFGALCQVLITAANALTGNLDRPGGVMFPRPALDPLTIPGGVSPGPGSYNRRQSRVRGLPEFSGELPVAALAEEIDTPGEGQIRALVTLAGNPVLSTPNGRRLEAALSGLEFMVSVDFYLNETTRHANLILPPPSPLERPHYDAAFHLLAIHNTTRYADAAVDPGPDARQEDQILLGLAGRLARHRGDWTEALRIAGLARLGVPGLVDLGLRLGPHGDGLRPWRTGLSVRALRAHPHGLDLGPLEPCLPARLIGRRKTVDLAPADALADLGRLVAEPAPPADALLLIGRRDVRDNNSWLHNSPKLMRGKSRCTLLIHPADAAARDLSEGALATVRSRVGEVSVPVALSDDMMPGVVCLPHGYGHHRPDTRQTTAARDPGVSVNDLQDELRVDALSGNAAFSGLPVQVARA